MTPAPPLQESRAPLATGNEWVALPAIERDSGGVRTVEVLSMRALGSLGLAAVAHPWEPGVVPASLLQPFCEVGGERRLGGRQAAGSEGREICPPGAGDGDPEFPPEPQLRWIEAWVPELAWNWDGLRLVATIWAPIGHRGFVYRLVATNSGEAPANVAFGLQGHWEHVVYSLFRSRPMPVSLRCRQDPWTGSLAMEALAAWPVVGWAVGWDEAPEILDWDGGSDGDGGSPGQQAVRFTVGRRLTLPPGGQAALTVYVTVAPEQDGARTTGVDLRRRGWEALLAETLHWLRARRTPLDDPELAWRVDRNRFFTHFFSCGRTLDSEEWVAVTSRSPRYYVSGAFWARDSLLWSLPGLLTVEPATAREVLRFAFRFGWRHPGMHAQYINGAVLYPGFELDELAAYPVALGRYLDVTQDETLLHEPEVRRALAEFPDVLHELAGPGPLYRTFLDPSDDPPPYPFLTYDNALLWRALVELVRIGRRAGLGRLTDWAERTARQLRQAILSTCVVEGPFGPMFAWAVDGQGRFTLYDDPPGSLQLLGVLGLCDPRDPALVNTIRWVHSPHNPHWYAGKFAEAGCAHSPHPWPMAAANTLLALAAMGRPSRPPIVAPAATGSAATPAAGHVEDVEARPAEAPLGEAPLAELWRGALTLLRQAPMDGELVCETVDPVTGKARSGAAFATAAGYVAWAILHALQQRLDPNVRHTRI